MSEVGLSVHHIALKVRDLGLCEKFYAQVLGLPVMDRLADESGAPRSVWLKCGDAILMLERADAETKIKNAGWHLMALKMPIDKRDGWKKKLTEHEVAIEDESPYSIFFKDPEGNKLALSHHPDE